MPAPLRRDPLPAIDVLLISHNHYDHLCDARISALVACGQRPRIFVPLGLKCWFDERGIPNVTELDWWDHADVTCDKDGKSLAQTIRIHLTPTQHWSRRMPFDSNTSLLGDYMVEQPPGANKAWRFLFPVDTGYSADFRAVRERLGTVDFLALPKGTYLPRDFRKPMHVNPDDVVQLMLDLS